MTQLPDNSPKPDDRLGRDLTALFDARIEVPAAVDEAIVRQIREPMATRSASGRRFRWVVAAAASLLMFGGVAILVSRQPAGGPVTGAPAAIVAGDVDGNGRVDILDAFALARSIERPGHVVDPRLDRNGDGRVDFEDVDELARRAVSLMQETS